VLSPLLYTLFTHDCCSSSPSTLIGKYADDTTIRGLFTGNDNTSYRREAERLGEWCGDHNVVLNTTETKEVIIDFRRARKLQHHPLGPIISNRTKPKIQYLDSAVHGTRWRKRT
jgi:hypothetical protein